MKTELNKLIAKIKKHEAEVAAARDKIRETINELESLGEHCDGAIEGLSDAADRLSELV